MKLIKFIDSCSNDVYLDLSKVVTVEFRNPQLNSQLYIVDYLLIINDYTPIQITKDTKDFIVGFLQD